MITSRQLKNKIISFENIMSEAATKHVKESYDHSTSLPFTGSEVSWLDSEFFVSSMVMNVLNIRNYTLCYEIMPYCGCGSQISMWTLSIIILSFYVCAYYKILACCFEVMHN